MFARKLGAGILVSWLVASGCAPGHYTGGGWLPSAADPDEKAHLAFNIHADDTNGDLKADSWKGQFQYMDRAAGVKFHGVAIDGGWPESYPSFVGYFIGTYEPQPKKAGPGGEFDAYVYDFDGHPEFGDSDYVDILVYDGVYAGYRNAGFLQGGNIKSHTK